MKVQQTLFYLIHCINAYIPGLIFYPDYDYHFEATVIDVLPTPLTLTTENFIAIGGLTNAYRLI